MRKIVISGIGMLSPAGLDLASAQNATFPIAPSGNSDKYPFHAALPAVLEVPASFSLRKIARKRKDIKLMASANQFAVAAADEAIRAAKLSEDNLTDAGLFIAVGREPSDLKALLPSVVHSMDGETFDLAKLFQEGLDWINPLSSLKTLPNMSLAHTAIHVGCRGPNMTLFGDQAFYQAVEAARESIALKRCDVALVGAADSCTSFFDRLAAAREGRGGLVGEGAAIFVMESLKHWQNREAPHYGFAEALDKQPQTSKFGYCGAATPALNLALDLRRAQRVPVVSAVHSESGTTDEQPRAVITGIGLVSPLGCQFPQFQTAIREGRSAVKPISHFDATHFSVKNACEVQTTDWWQRIPDALQMLLARVNERSANFAVSSALAALDDANIETHPETVIYGTGLSSVSLDELRQDCLPYLSEASPFLRFSDIRVSAPDVSYVSPHRHRMNLPLEALCTYWKQPVENIVHFSACAAGAASIGHGLDLIRSGQKSCVLVGAADAMIHPYGLIPFAKLGATSIVTDPTIAARPFDKDRSGFVMGETAAFFLLESASHAHERKAHVYGELLGWGSSCDAHNVTAPHPDGLGAVASMNAALRDANLSPFDIDYINAHGTGTFLNDIAETSAIEHVFGQACPWVSSSKAQFGHCIGAAGAIEFAVGLAALCGGFIPGNVSLLSPDTAINVRLAPRHCMDFGVRYVLSNSFGFGGQNVSLIVGPSGEN